MRSIRGRQGDQDGRSRPGALRNNLRLAKSQDRQALISYQQTIQRAFGDVSDALIGYDKYHGVRERQEQTVKDLQESVDVSLMRYRGGTANYIDVLDSQRSCFKRSSRLRRRETTNTRAWSSFTKRSAAGGSKQEALRRCSFSSFLAPAFNSTAKIGPSPVLPYWH